MINRINTSTPVYDIRKQQPLQISKTEETMESAAERRREAEIQSDNNGHQINILA